MAESTGISWADATFNPWVGCEKVSPGCAHCYAEEWATGWPGTAKGTWGDDGTRRRTSPAKWREPLKWARLAREGRLPNGSENRDGHRPRVFCASLADVFEERPELEQWRRDLFDLIAETAELDWLVLTKRPDFAQTWLPSWWSVLRYDPLPNVWLGVSIENARHTWRADVLRQIPAAVRFISAEPLLGSLFAEATPRARRRDREASLAVVEGFIEEGMTGDDASAYVREVESKLPNRSTRPLDLSGIDWIIVGGESGPGARPFHLEHAREIIRAARAFDDPCSNCGEGMPCAYDSTGRHNGCVPAPAVFVKQLGAKPHVRSFIEGNRVPMIALRDRKGGDIAEWPADLRVREFPRSAT